MPTRWRDVTDAEAAALPEARLGGALLALVLCAVAATLAGLGALSSNLLFFGVARGFSLQAMMNASPKELPGFIFFAQSMTLTFWCALFAIMTVARVPATPIVTTVGFGLQLVFAIATPIVSRLIVSLGGADAIEFLFLLAPLTPQWIGWLMLTVGLSAYLLGGVRPNLYFRRRAFDPTS